MNKVVSKLLPMMMAFVLMFTFGTYTKAETAQQTDVTEIATAEDLLAINRNLSGHYKLTADIDLSSYENWPMIGAYIMDPSSPEGEDPIPEAAFSGVFDGNGHTISNVTIDASADMEKMFGIGFFACVGHGGVVKDVTFQDINVKGMMLVGGVIGYAFECTVDNVDLKASERNTVESTMVMAGGVVGGLTCSRCVNCDVENTDIKAAPGGNSGILGGGFSKPVLENCTVKNSTLSGKMEGVPAFGMDGGNWLGGLTGCINLDDYDVNDWYVSNCRVSDVEISVSGKGAYVGGLIGSAGGELKSADAPRMKISGCALENVTISVTDNIPCVGGAVGGSFTEGGPIHSFLIDGCTLTNVSIVTDAESLETNQTGKVIGQAANCQFAGKDNMPLDIADSTIQAEDINSTADVTILHTDGSAFDNAMLVGQIIEGNAQQADVIEIASAEDLAAINKNLSGHYVLTADIDLAGQEWTPLGAYAPSGESEEEQEIPSADHAFTGVFDGQGHTIRNLVINQPEGWALGLFGCIANAEVSNFTLENATVDGSVMASCVAGYTYCSTISNVKLIGGKVTVHYTEMSAEGMYGGIAGAGNGSLISGCEAQADIVIPDGTANTGIIGGGLQMTNVVNCKATGSITAGNNCYGLGGISGCGFASEQFTDCAADSVTITAGDNCFWIGGITGYAGGYAAEELGMPVTVFTNCSVRNIRVTAGENADGIGDIVGHGFYSDELAANGAPFDQPTQFELVNCTAE